MMIKFKQLMKLIWLTLIALSLFATVALAQSGDKEVLVIDVDEPITQATSGYIERAIAEADVRNVEALIVRLNTPGGGVGITEQIVQMMIGSDVPVVVYVWPSGGFAASAGTLITLAGHAAAMAPGTTIGAASPVGPGGVDLGETLQAKTENILVAEIKNLADRRGEKASKWAEEAITEAKAATAEEALEIGVVDFIAKDVDDLLAQLDGFTVEVGGDEVVLSTNNAHYSFLEATMLEDFLKVISNPTLALLLVWIGAMSIIYEFINPGGYMGGIIGAILLLIGLYGIGQLPFNYAGLALIIIALLLLIAEIFTPTFGALTVAGVIAFIIGAVILFNTAEFSYRLPLISIIGIPLAMAAIVGFGLRKIVQSMKPRPTTGQEGLVGAMGIVKVALDPQGSVFVWGERWQASSEDDQPISVGERVKVTEVDGFRLKVKKVKD